MKKIKRIWLITKQYQGYQSSCDLKVNVDQFELIDVTEIGKVTKTGLGGIWDQTNWDNVVWDFSEVAQQEIKMRVKGKSIQFQMENSNIDEPITFYGIVIEYQAKKP